MTCAAGGNQSPLGVVRDLEVIDSELRLLTAVRRTVREHGGELSIRHVDESLDEGLASAHRGRRVERGRSGRKRLVKVP